VSGTYTQEHRFIRIATALPPDTLLLQGFRGVEGISRLFHFELDLLSEDKSIAFSDVVGKPAVVYLSLADGKPRHFHGYISRFRQSGAEDKFFRYSAELVPRLWFLKRSVNCRIFQDKSVIDIIKEVLEESGLSDHAVHTQGTYSPLEYCVQYRESNFDFISRLMEEHGIFYFFQHENTTHTLILGDKPSAHQNCPGQHLAHLDLTGGGPDEDDVITAWKMEQEFRSGKYALADYNFETPAIDLSSSLTSTVPIQGNDAFEIYDYPGGFGTRADGDAAVGWRMEEEESQHKVIEGESVCRSFSAGYKFELKEHFRRDMNGTYVLTTVQHRASVGDQYIGGEEVGENYSNTFHCVPLSVPYRPLRSSPKPVMHGLQTAVVVGPPGEEIYTDKYGRVKVQFHWDRLGKHDEKSSCWIRVATAAAGKRWGSVVIPRIGWEVVVGFEEGDPDRPLIVGSLYNAGMMPPYTLPDEKTKTTLKSYSSKGGGGFNEVRIEDKKGSEQIFIHGQKDLHLRVKNDVYETILNEHHTGVTADRFIKVGGDNHTDITGNHNQKVGGAVSLKAGMDLLQKAGMKIAADAGTEIHLKAGATLVMEAGVSLTLKVGGNYINLNPGGVFITGTMVMINSGGAAGSGSGCSPQAPKAPTEADTAEAGQAAEKPPRKTPPEVKTYSTAALVLKQAAADGAPLCDLNPN